MLMPSSKVWFITGASRGFGRIWAEAALRRGDKVIATARNPKALNDLALAHGDALLVLPLDVTDRNAVFDAIGRGRRHFARLDIVLSNAGYGYMGALEELEPEPARASFETNVFGTLWVIQAAMPILRAQGGGHVLTVSSIGGIISFPTGDLYCDEICRRSHVGSSGRGSERVRRQSHDHRTGPFHNRVSLSGTVSACHRRLRSHTTSCSIVIQAGGFR
jgi:NADP-dependent 3-hydroxy acid dehydrogenase YdfG